MTTSAAPDRDARIASALLWICAGAAVLATVSAAPGALAADAATRFVEIWRVVGFATFAGLFAVLAARTTEISSGVWVVMIANKLVLTIAALSLAGTTPGAGQAVGWDGALTVLLVTAFLLTRGRRG
ncbi:MAG: hypothetical protein IT193_13750 [Propionibacteriaceae bacterium]|nr:hypothetical protein [Propionibacteriaceae bacterium]